MNYPLSRPSISPEDYDALTRSLTSIQQRLAGLRPGFPQPKGAPAGTPSPPSLLGDDLTLSRAKELYRDRRRRAKMFGEAADLFREPAWDMLLDLFICQTEGRALSVSDACIASGVPGTTALRHIGRLEERGLLSRSPDPFDMRRCYLRLTAFGLDTMRACLQGEQ